MASPEIARIEATMPFQRRTWLAERIGWFGMGAVVAAGLAGLLGGGGPLATGRMEAGGVTIEWPRMARLGLTEPLRLVAPADATVRLDSSSAPDWRLRDGTRGGDVQVLHLEPIGSPGPRRLRLEVAGQRLDLPVFVWP